MIQLVVFFSSGFYSVGIYSKEPYHSVLVIFKCFFDGTLMELESYYANRTLIVSCTRGYI